MFNSAFLFSAQHLVIKCGLLTSLFCIASAQEVRADDGMSADTLNYQSSEFDWTLKRDKRDIQIYTSKVTGSNYVAVLSVMTVKASAQSLAALVVDFDYCSKWAAMCKHAEVQEQLSANESIVYSLNNAPFPVRDRDVVAKVRWLVDDESQKISMLSRAIDSDVPRRKGAIRVKYAVSEWHFTPQENGETLVENFAHVDPNGAVPAWVVNILIIDSPYKTFKKMRRLVESGKYDDVVLSFIGSPKDSQ